MKKALILAYDFPPYVSVGGLRPYSWYKYLKEFDIEPIIVTRQWDNKYGNKLDYIAGSKSKVVETEETEYGVIIKTPYVSNLSNKIILKFGTNRFVLLRKIISGYYEFAQWFICVGPKKELYKAANTYIENNHIDIIIATGDPFILFKYGSKLSNKHNIPWIADYRDPWTQNNNNSKNSFIRKFNSFHEKKFLRNSALVTTVSSFVINQIKKLINKEFKIIPNGYNPDAISEAQSITQEKELLQIAFVGTIYKWHPLESFLRVCNIFVQNENRKFQINFYGINNEDEINELISSKYQSLTKHITIFPRIPNEVLLKELAKHNLFLLFNYYSYMGTKIYDYIALKRKVIFCYSSDEEADLLKKRFYITDDSESINDHIQEDIIKETNSGVVVKNSNSLLHVLEDMYSEFITKREIECNSFDTEQYSRKNQAKVLSEVMYSVIKTKPHQQCLICNSTHLKPLYGYEKDSLVKCQDCRFVFSQKIPTQKELVKYYEDTYSRDDYLSPITIKRYNEVLDFLEKYRKTNRLLDLGSGIGYFLEVAKLRGWEVFGTEFTEDAFQICQKKGATMHMGPLNTDNYNPDFFDVITSFEVIEHINNPRDELPVYKEILRKGGVIYFTTPNFHSIERYVLKGKYSAIKYPEHLSYYSKKTINYLFNKNEFKKIKLETTGFSLSRIRHSLRSNDTFKVTKTYDDEIIRQNFEKSSLMRFSKNIINRLLNLFNVGNSLKGLYQKE